MSLRRRVVLGGLIAAPLAGLSTVSIATANAGTTGVNGASWMSGLSDDIGIDDVSIPGSHDTCALIGGPFDTAKCQDLTLPEQLEAGVRFIDIRCRLHEGAFTIHHGPIYQEKNFTDVLSDCRDFLDANPGETIIMSLQQEYSEAPDEEFAALFNDRYMDEEGFDSLLYREGTIPTLGRARGKVVLLAKVGGIDGIDNGDADLVATQNDWEADVDPKWELVREHLDEAAYNQPEDGRLFVNYTSTTAGATIPQPRDYAETLNPRTRDHVADAGTACFGVIVSDFVGSVAEDLIEKLIASNGLK